MLLIRRFEERCAIEYQATRIRGFLHLYIGEEAVAVGCLEALEPRDNVLGTYREHGRARGRDGGDVRQGRRLQPRARRLDAPVLGRAPVLRWPRDRRRRAAGRGRARARRPGARHGRGHGGVLRRGRGGRGRIPRGDEPRRPVAAAGRVRMREQPVRDGHGDRARPGADRALAPGRRVRHLGRGGRRHGRRRGRGGGAAHRRARARGARALPARGAHVPLPRALDVRPRALPRQGGGRALARAMPDRDVRRAPPGRGAALGGGAGDDRGRRPGADRHRGRVRGGRGVRAGRGPPARRGGAVKTTYRDAARESLRAALAGDPRVIVMGEDIGRYGGTYAVTRGLLDEFGPERVRDTPLSESGFVGAGVGAAMNGLRPIVEIMTVNFSLLALDQLVNGAALMRHMSGGQLNVPLVVRMATGAGRQLAAQHSHSLEGWFAHVPGLRVIAPATIDDARWMLASALTLPDPVILFEHVGLYALEGELAEPGGPVDLARAAVRRAGRDVTLVTYGGSVPKALAAAGRLAERGVDAEVIDLRVLRPLDVATIVGSVTRTRRAVVIDEMWRTGSFAAEIAATITERAFYELDAPVARVCSAEVPIPYAKHLEDAALPSIDAIVAAAAAALEGGP
ncbi:MAG: alpha-ketoacid dehydrogenase subunit beta [Deltaproteobacteria bacterium]|nr:alpha-ketoacid dehydrogenase subunit beta [Kofleriaceae bacterium]